VDKIGRDIEKANARGAEVAGKMRSVYDPDEITEAAAERRVERFRVASVEDRHRALLKAIKSCVIEGDTVTLIGSGREIFKWKA
jgi:UDP-N-acetylmuramyl tripeptide synthase